MASFTYTCVGGAECYTTYGVCSGEHVGCVQEVVDDTLRMQEMEGLRRIVEVLDATRHMQETVEGMLAVCCRRWRAWDVCGGGGALWWCCSMVAVVKGM
jgi:hypothetical protein